MLKNWKKGNPFISGGTFLPPADNAYDLGSSALEWKDIYIDGTANIDILSATTLGGAIAGGNQSFTNVGDMTFAAGSILAAGTTNADTLLIKAGGIAGTTFITLTSNATDTMALGAFTLGGAVAGGDQAFTGVGDMTFTSGSILAAVDGAGTTLLVKAGGLAGTTFITLTSQSAGTDTMGLGAFTLGGTVTLNGQTFSGTAKFSAGINTGGTTPTGYIYNYFGGNLASDGASSWAGKQAFEGVVTGATGDTSFLVGTSLGNEITCQASDTIGYIAQLRVVEPTITIGSATATIAATIYVVNAPTEGTTNAAIYVASGATNLADLVLRGTTTALTFANAATIVATSGLTMPAFTLGGQVTMGANNIMFGGGQGIVSSVNNNYIKYLGGNDEYGATFFLYGKSHGSYPGGLDFHNGNAALNAVITRLMITGAVDTAVATWSAITHTGLNITSGQALQVAGTQVVGARVVDTRADDAVSLGAYDATTGGVIDALRDAMITHGLIAAA